MKETLTKEYRIAAKLRRCCWYVIIATPGIICVALWVGRIVPKRDMVSLCIGCALLAAALLLPLRWRMRVGPNGVARRLLFNWDTWPWSDFASGRLQKLHPCTLLDPERPWWNRRLRLGCMAADDIREVMAAINVHYRLPPPPDVPDRLTIKYGWRRSAVLDDKGIHLLVRGQPREYLWRDVRNVHITRMDQIRRDFASLLLTLPEQEIELKLISHQGGTSPSWRSATSEQINEFLLGNLDSDKIDISIAGEQPTKREHVEKKLEAARKQKREMVIIGAVFLTLIVGFLAWMAVDEGIFAALGMGAMLAIWPGSVFVMMYRLQVKKVDELTAALDGFSTRDVDGSTTISGH